MTKHVAIAAVLFAAVTFPAAAQPEADTSRVGQPIPDTTWQVASPGFASGGVAGATGPVFPMDAELFAICNEEDGSEAVSINFATNPHRWGWLGLPEGLGQAVGQNESLRRFDVTAHIDGVPESWEATHKNGSEDLLMLDAVGALRAARSTVAITVPWKTFLTDVDEARWEWPMAGAADAITAACGTE